MILKIGGSVITDKSHGVFEVAREREIERIAKEIASNPESMILVHGVGSFGHPYVEKYGLREKKDVRKVLKTHLACKRLNSMVCEALLAEGVNASPIHPFSAFRLKDKLEFDSGFILSLLRNQMLPVIHGDMVYNPLKDKFEVLSGDRIVVELAKSFKAKRVGFATDMAGIVVNGEIVEEVNKSNLAKVLESIGESEAKSDVTGGMKGKIELMVGIKDSEVFIFSGLDGSIKKFLKGERVGTRLKP
jgi:isopentenyl phosphate kinase